MHIDPAPAAHKSGGRTGVALVHHWLTGMRGGEKVLEALCDIFPGADIFTLVCDQSRISDKLRSHRINTSFIQRLPMGLRRFRAYLPLLPMAAEQFDLSDYHLVISSDASLIKSIRVPHGVHVCYCYSPPRYLWDLYDIYRGEEANAVQRLVMPVVAPILRRRDFDAAQRVDHFIANSAAVAHRIETNYHRPATIIHPPVNVDFFSAAARRPADFYLFVGQLVAYKRADLAIRAANAQGRPLVVIGDGPQRSRLEQMAGPLVRFLGSVDDDVLRDHYARCRALIFPNEEDFGIVPVEAQAAGAPIIAFAAGGALETVVDGVTGFFFEDVAPDSLADAIGRFESRADTFTEAACRDNARHFDYPVFIREFQQFISALPVAAAHG